MNPEREVFDTLHSEIPKKVLFLFSGIEEITIHI
jgi:hypothetical protein